MIPIPAKSDTPDIPGRPTHDIGVARRDCPPARSGGRKALRRLGAATLTAGALVAAGCGSSGSPSPGSSSAAAGHTGGTYTILANSAFGVADLAQNYTLEEWQLAIDTHDGLVQFKRVGGTAGTQIVPDLAASIPTPTAGGKTYVFHIRKGTKFSNGQVVKPTDFLTAFERQLAGYPDKIVEKYGQTVSDEVTAVQNGQADEVFDGDVIPADRLNELNGAQYAKQVHVNPLTADWYFAFNTKQPPFNNLKARQAANFAADRNAYVKIGGGPSLAVPTCQVLPPNFPGSKPYCPYTAGSDTTKWTGPDLAKAKALVKASGTAGMKVVVNTDIPDKALGEQMVSDLNKIGYKASLQALA